MKPALVFGTAGTQMPPFMVILISWIPSSRAEDAEARRGLVGSLGALHVGTGTTVVLVSASMCDIVRSFLAEGLWSRISRAATRMSAWRLNWRK